MSSLGRLFDYAKVSTVDVRENYTTQALAEACRHDPRPIIVALAHAGVLGIDAGTAWRLEATTQWSYPDAVSPGGGDEEGDDDGVSGAAHRFVDLVLLLADETGACEVWIEVKTGSGIHGDQLDRYRAYIDAHRAEMSRELVLLAPEHLDTDVPLTHIRWQEVADAIRRSGTRSEWWLDLAVYLEEIRMTEHWTLPVTAREAVALEDAHHLFRKAYAVLREVNDRLVARPTTPGGKSIPDFFGWPNAWVSRTCQSQFADKGRVMLWNQGGRPVATFFGYVPVGGEVMMAVWVEADPRNTTARQQVRSWAAERLPEWERPGDAWQLVQTTTRAVLVETREEAAAWFMARLSEIVDAGLYDELFPASAESGPTDSEATT